MKKGQIITIVGDKRKVKYKIRWQNGSVSDEIATSLWLSTEPEESDTSSSDEDYEPEKDLEHQIDDISEVDYWFESDMEDYLNDIQLAQNM